MRTDQKIEWYSLWWSDKPVQESAKDAIKAYIKKHGTPPSIILYPPEEDLKPMDEYNFVVRVDPYVVSQTLLIGVIDNEDFEASIRLEG